MDLDIDGVVEKLNYFDNSDYAISNYPPVTTGNFVLARDNSTTNPTFACGPLVNPEEINGKFCVVDRGTCFFAAKAANCIAAGAVAVLVVNRYLLLLFRVEP